jgi:REP element-mobilizing transposase RayT
MMIKSNQSRWNRRNLRLGGHDYSDPGAYFITVCTRLNGCILGDVHEAAIQLNPLGETVQSVLQNVGSYHEGVTVDTMVVMPDHIHTVLMVDDGESVSIKPKPSIPKIIHSFKSYTTHLCRSVPLTSHAFDSKTVLWQRNYYEHVIRTPTSLQLIREYIHSNPARLWQRMVSNPNKVL